MVNTHFSKIQSAKFTHLVLTIFSLLFISACAQKTQVHLYAKYAEPEQVTELTEALLEADFNVTSNQLSIPQEITHSSILYSPLLKSREDLAKVKAITEQLGWQNLQEDSLVSGNHWYTKNSMALFLLPDGEKGKQRIATKNLVNRYQSTQCDQEISLTFADNGRYQLEFSNNNKNQRAFAKGDWKVTSLPYISLRSDDGIWWFYLTVRQEDAVDKIGKAKLTILTPVENYTQFPQCDLVFGERV